jgi:ATP-dependent Lon protease
MPDDKCCYIFKKGKLKNKKCGKDVVINTPYCPDHIKRIGASNDTFEKVAQLKTTEGNKQIILKHYTNLKSLDSGSSEYYKNNLFIDWCLRVPFGEYKNFPVRLNENSRDEIKNFVNEIKSSLDEEIWGLEHVKNEILNFIVKMITNPKSKRNILALYGPPGVGKTKFIQVLSKVLSLPYQIISLGGLKDASFLNGHGYVYVESSPGKIMQSIIDSRCFNGILYFDELDKVSGTDGGKDIYSTLMFITDPSQNHSYRDHYFNGMTFDLSDMFFSFTFNDISKIDKVLLDRLNIIYVDIPSKKDKVVIIRDFCFPEIVENIGLPQDIQIDDEAIEYILRCIDVDSVGVRSIYRVLEKMLMEINKDQILNDIQIKKITLQIAKEYFIKIQSQIGGILDLVNDQPPCSMYL